jgi:hypothetical protein
VPTIEEARDAFLRGRSFMVQEKWTYAEQEILFAVRAKNTPRLHYYIGHCRENQGRLLEALQSYRLAEELLETQKAPDVDQIVPVAIGRVSELLPVVVLHDVPAGARLKWDEVEQPLSDQLSANPGSHRLLIEKEGFVPFTTTVELKPGGKAHVHVKLLPVDGREKPVANEDAVPSRSEGLRKVLFWSSTGIGAAGLGVGVTGVVLFSSTKRELRELNEQAEELSDGADDSCVDPSTGLESICDDLARGAKRKNTMGNLMVGGFIGAGVGTLGAVVTHFFWPEAKVRVAVGFSESETAVLLSGHF